MFQTLRLIFACFLLFAPSFSGAILQVGIGKTEITPPVGTPSAGYADRKGAPMEGSHDPLLAIALFIDNGEKQVVFCSVDHLGFTHEMVQEVAKEARSHPKLAQCEIYIGSSHTHSGGGAYLNIPFVGEMLAGPYNAETTRFYIQKTAQAIVQATHNLTEAKVGIGYGRAQRLSYFRSTWPKNASPLDDVAVIKVTRLDDTPLAVLFNYPVHPTVLRSQNRLFSSDFVGDARVQLAALLGGDVQPLYFNGAQGDINPAVTDGENRFASKAALGQSLAQTVKTIWEQTPTQKELSIQTLKDPYVFKPQATPQGMALPLEAYASEMNLIVLNRSHAFITIPGELSSLYDQSLKTQGQALGYSHVSIFGLTNDAHGYIILPDAWEHQTFESNLSFGGKNYGHFIEQKALELLKAEAPR